MKQCTCYALRAIDCTCKPAKYGELYTSPTAKQEQGEPVAEITVKNGHWIDTTGFSAVKKLADGIHKLYTTPQPKKEQGEPDKYVMDIECTKCGAKQSGILTVNTTPQQRKSLTDEQIQAIAKEHIAVGTRSFEEFARRIEAAHGIKE
jgi:predicted nucleic-acid-binding Zn-ribbon protein